MYNKLFGKILDSSIWLEDSYTRIVWITLLAAMDQDGYAHFSAVANLANRAQVPLDKAEIAVEKLMAPDTESGDPEHEGRRIERIPGGFIILNATKYREIATRIVQREQTKKRVAKHRANKHVTGGNDSVTQSEAYTTTEAKIKTKARFTRPSVDEVRDYCYHRQNKVDPQSFVDFYEANGWVQGKGKPIKDWKACVRTWERGNGKSRKLSAVERVEQANKRKTGRTIDGQLID